MGTLILRNNIREMVVFVKVYTIQVSIILSDIEVNFDSLEVKDYDLYHLQLMFIDIHNNLPF